MCAILIFLSACTSPVYVRSQGFEGGGGGGGRRSGSGTPAGESMLMGSGGSLGGEGGLVGQPGELRPAGGAGGGPGGAGTGGVVCEAGVGGAASADQAGGGGARYDFETSVQSWKIGDGSAPSLTIASSAAQHFDGQASLAVSFSASGPSWYELMVDPVTPAIPAGALVTLHIFVPADAALLWVKPYVQETANAWTWTGLLADAACLSRDTWTTLQVSVPAIGTAPVARLGMHFYLAAAWSGTIYVDGVTW